ncbi:MAG TPA: response regulator [Parasegetibacter sp.]|jgi:CheY-like chemotaxis protein
MKATILAVDDSKAIRFLLQSIFGKEYNVVTASDACSAMYWLGKKNFPSMIIADPEMPDCENWDLIYNLKNSGLYGDIPVVVLTGLPEDEVRLKCLELQVSKYFLKPFNPLELVDFVKEITEPVENYQHLTGKAS